MTILAAATAQTDADASTWVFLGVLALMTAGILYGWARAISHYRPPAWRPDLVNPQRYYAQHGIHDEIDLGRHWRSTDDPGAYWHVWWLPDRGQIIGVRTAMQPPPTGRYLTGGVSRWSWGYDQTGIAGMKTLGTVSRLDRRSTEQLRRRPDGLDILCGGTGIHDHVLAS